MSWFTEVTPNWTILVVSIFATIIGFVYGYLVGTKRKIEGEK